MDIGKIREPIVDGIFYPEDPGELRERIEGFLASAGWSLVERTERKAAGTADETGGGEMYGAVTPHAAYDFCGDILAAGLVPAAALDIETVVIIGPVHREREDTIFLSESAAFRTPLGIVPVDRVLTEEIGSCSNRIIHNDIPHLEEHCLEIQLPFVQVLFPETTIVPILMGAPTVSNYRALAGALDLSLGEGGKGKRTLILATSNLSSASGEAESAAHTDLAKKLILAEDPRGLTDRDNLKRMSLCGPACIACLLSLRSHAEGRTAVRLLAESSSSKNEPAAETVVHYAAFGLFEGD
jgi:hypothetical protein